LSPALPSTVEQFLSIFGSAVKKLDGFALPVTLGISVSHESPRRA
jgi:hypothetical protein